jgi:hypothetical protein
LNSTPNPNQWSKFSEVSGFGPYFWDAMDKRRNAPRHRVLKAGTIGFGGSAINCMVRNILDIPDDIPADGCFL